MKDLSFKTIMLYSLEFIIVTVCAVVLLNGNLNYPKALSQKKETENAVAKLSAELEELNTTSYQLADNNDLMSQQLENESQVLEKLKLINSNYVKVDISVIESVSDTIDTVKVTMSGDIDLGYDALKSIIQPTTAIHSYSLIGTDNPELNVVLNVKR